MAHERDAQQPAETGSRRGRPIAEFLHTEAAGGIVLVIAAVVALVWANSPWKQSYFDLWHTHLTISLGARTLDLTLEEWVNDGLMTIFFFVVGLEVKRELVEGELRDPRRGGAARHRRGRRDVGAGADLPGDQRRRRGRRAAGASRWRPTSPSPSAW